MIRSELISPEYANLNQLKHDGEFWGGSGRKFAKEVIEFYNVIGALSLLDYGCGRGSLKHSLEDKQFRGMISEYDPAIRGKDALPSHADLVVCTDVLEHIEPEKIDKVLGHILSLANLGAFLVISLRSCDHKLPDGRGCHLIVESAEWWMKKINSFPGLSGTYETEFLNGTEKEKRLRVWVIK